MIGALQKLWRGEYSLRMALFGFCFFGGLCVGIAGFALIAIFAKVWFALGFYLAIIVFIAYQFVASVGVWRSARVNLASQNTGERFEAIGARGLVLLAGVHLLWKLYSNGAIWALLK